MELAQQVPRGGDGAAGGEAAEEEREGVGRERDGGGRPEGQRHRRVDVRVRRGADGGGEVGGGQSAPC